LNKRNVIAVADSFHDAPPTRHRSPHDARIPTPHNDRHVVEAFAVHRPLPREAHKRVAITFDFVTTQRSVDDGDINTRIVLTQAHLFHYQCAIVSMIGSKA
jgi:hypothetical protein